MTPVKRNSYFFVLAAIVLAGWLDLGAPLITILFSYFVLNKLSFLKRDWLTVSIFVILVSIICAATGYFIDQTIKTLPHVMEAAIPAFIQFAKEHGFEMPFSDWDSLKSFALESVVSELRLVGNFAKIATKKTILIIIGIVISVSLYLNRAVVFRVEKRQNHDHLYGALTDEITARFVSLYQSFAKVMGAQLIISAINTSLTAVFVLCVSLPYAALVVAITFFCGLLPIVGNLLSNSFIVAIGFTVSPNLAIGALVFLVVLHKLEYFLNSKIIGKQIKSPVWLTLIGLVVGERLMGISGMILAPVILHFIKVEASQIAVAPAEADSGSEDRP
jgi:predicted PurR-regulated permease PerM